MAYKQQTLLFFVIIFMVELWRSRLYMNMVRLWETLYFSIYIPTQYKGNKIAL